MKSLMNRKFSGGYRQRFVCTGEFRPPLKGEWFLSGAIVAAYQAPNDLSTKYWIAKEIKHAK